MFKSVSWRPGRSGFACGLAMAAVLTAAGCTSGTSGTAAAGGGRPTLKVAAIYMPSAIDPAKGIDALFSFVETLTKVNDQGVVTPFLLTALPTRTDSTHWVLTLKPGVTFQDGHPMDAATVAAGMNRGVKLSDDGKASLPGAVFSATGPLQITVDTGTAQPLLPYTLTDPAFAVYDEPVVAAAGTAPDALAGKGVFTAPYAITSFTARGMDLTSYDKYWQGKPALSGVKVTYVADALARAAAVESGQADMADGANAPDVVQAVSGRTDVSLKLSDVPVVRDALYFNPSTGPFTDVNVRRAVAMALNYSDLGSKFTGGIGGPATGLTPSSNALAAPTQKTDAAQAGQLLDAAGWTVGGDGVRSKDGQRLSLALLIYNERPEMKPLSIGIQTMLKQIGVDTKITTQPYDPKMYDNAKKWNLALFNEYSISSTSAPDAYFAQDLSSHGGSNYWHIADPRLDKLLADLPAATDRKSALAAVQQYIWDNSYVVIVSYSKDGALVSKKWQSYTPDDGYALGEWTWQTAPGS
jgi:peptide/nickel transport system substrate-binding protein